MNARVFASPGALWAIASALLLTLGCDDPLKSVALIEETRVLGARVEVQGDPGRASPHPGEHATVSFFVASPQGDPALTDELSVCGVSPTDNGFPNCATPAFAQTSRTEPSAGSPTLDFQVPSELDLSVAPHGFVQGAIADTNVAFEFELGSGGQENLNPALDDNALTLDGVPWSASATAMNCADFSPIPAGSRHELGATLSDASFEHLTPSSSLDPTRETLLLSEFCTAGSLDHAFSSLSPSTSESGSALWSAPASAEASGSLVHFYFVVRDSRGGEAWTARTLCVLP